MGGHQGGETASRLAVETIESSFSRNTTLPITERIRSAINDASAAIFDAAQTSPALKGMGTTCVMLVTDKPAGRLWIAHVGDSRCYRLTPKGDFQRMTKDHSRVQEMVDAGWITPDDAAQSEVKNVITRALGIERTAQADVSGPLSFANGDRFLLCSDGLTDMLSDVDIASILGRVDKPQEAAEELVNLANLRGGHDNITVCIAAFGKRKPVYPKTFIEEHGGLADTKVERTRLGRMWQYGQYAVFSMLFCAILLALVYLFKPKILPVPLRTVFENISKLLLRRTCGEPLTAHDSYSVIKGVGTASDAPEPSTVTNGLGDALAAPSSTNQPASSTNVFATELFIPDNTNKP